MQRGLALYKKHTGKLFKKFKEHPENLILTTRRAESPHAFSIKKIVDNGLMLVDTNSKKNEEIFVSFDKFYSEFNAVNFARLRPEKMFKMLDETRKKALNVIDSDVFVHPTPTLIRDSAISDVRKDINVLIKDYV